MHDEVKNYYGNVLQASHDLKTNACCSVPPPEFLRQLLGKLHAEVKNRYFGCGLVTPEVLQGAHVLDLGCGAGRDVYLLSALTGENGCVVGVDMTTAQLAVAREYQDYHADAFGYQRSNAKFLEGYIERLDELGLSDNQFDIIVSNCVINLSPDKAAVLKQAWRVLKPGGELYFSDVYADRRIPEELKQDSTLYGECLSGAMYWNDFIHLAKQCGFGDPRLVEDRPIIIDDAAIQTKLNNIHFYSATYRLFKIADLEPACEDYGQAVIYNGGIERSPDIFLLDKHHLIELGRVFPVCGNTWRMLKETRFAPYFTFIGDFSRHFGLFKGCGGELPFDHLTAETASCC